MEEKDTVARNAREGIGVALSGGVARVSAHIGVLRALEEAKIPIRAIAGTSGGSLVGAYYAAGRSSDEIVELARNLSWKRLSNVTLPKMGLFSNEKMEKLINEELGHARFEDLPVPFAVVGADLTTGKKIVFTRGSVAAAVRGSCSIPQVFTPVMIDGHLIADGGLVEYLPIQTLQSMGCEVTVGVNLGSTRNWEAHPRNFLELALRVIGYVSQRNAAVSERYASVVIHPDLADFGSYDLDRVDDLVECGYQSARRVLPSIHAALEANANRHGIGGFVRRIRARFAPAGLPGRGL
ncbi:MAG: hypothetical protein CME07_03965 [Gemmatimonadetes bacterium]|nr:hypothetical protein [Gemmatimonadota bacterium]